MLPAEAGRYHLVVSAGCPFCHRTTLLRALKGLEVMPAAHLLAPDVPLCQCAWHRQHSAYGKLLCCYQSAHCRCVRGAVYGSGSKWHVALPAITHGSCPAGDAALPRCVPSQGAVSVGYTLPPRDPEHGFLFPAPGVRDERYLEATGVSPSNPCPQTWRHA